ncbi:hypothetical protein CWC05_02580 [Pseudoalteromonas ruthenica]|uniref:Uncharacterized protein n=1 Tax=Pseudoalteromonas ruthenica TaxID=151081 RepID=A0A5S3Z7W7_9GAMM|nr:DUF3693 domain-containing protein [Pseudoalteromonas ruthenica]TMP88339.1 hypothetical protein CWC05_02580 [Pseudoalteromonas ruthenica]
MFSAELIEKYKVFKGYTQDKQVVADLEAISAGRLSEIKKGKRHLTPNQCIFLAESIGMDYKEALVQLAIEKSKNEKEKSAWEDVAKKISAACAALVLVLGLGQQPAEAPASV